jgi:hypothetical protein
MEGRSDTAIARQLDAERPLLNRAGADGSSVALSMSSLVDGVVFTVVEGLAMGGAVPHRS